MVIGLKYRYEIKLGCSDNGVMAKIVLFFHKKGRETCESEWNGANALQSCYREQFYAHVHLELGYNRVWLGGYLSHLKPN